MRRPHLSFSGGKALLFLLVAGMTFGVSSCSKDDKDDSKTAVSQEAAATVVTQSVTSQGGIVEQIETAAGVITTLGARTSGGRLSDFCGESKGDSLILNGEIGEIKYSINYGWSLTLNCVDETPTEFAYTLAGKSSLETEQFATNDSTIASYKIGGLGGNDSTWVFNLSLDREAILTSKTSEFPSFNSNIHYTATNIKVDPELYEIVSGTVSVTISGVDLKGKTFRYEGTITFQGDRKAVFTVNGGGSFNLNW